MLSYSCAFDPYTRLMAIYHDHAQVVVTHLKTSGKGTMMEAFNEVAIERILNTYHSLCNELTDLVTAVDNGRSTIELSRDKALRIIEDIRKEIHLLRDYNLVLEFLAVPQAA